MTLRYKLFRIPGNEDELAEEVERLGVNEVDMNFTPHKDHVEAGAPLRKYGCTLDFRPGDGEFRFPPRRYTVRDEMRKVRSDDLEGAWLEMLTFQRRTLDEGIEIGRSLDDRGFEVEYNGHPLEVAERDLANYDLRIRQVVNHPERS